MLLKRTSTEGNLDEEVKTAEPGGGTGGIGADGTTLAKRKTRVRKVSKRRPYGRILDHLTVNREINGVMRKHEYHATKGWRVTRQ
jgi:hypothetical protein